MPWYLVKERRGRTRVRVKLPLKVVRSKAPDEEAERAHTTTISHRGLSFVSRKVLELREPITAVVGLPGNAGEISLEAAIVRVGSEGNGVDTFEYGVEFKGSQPPSALKQFLQAVDVVPLLDEMGKRRASSLHVSAFSAPTLRVGESLEAVGEPPASPKMAEWLILGTMNPERREELRTAKEIEYVLLMPEVGRWRVNVHYQQGLLEATYRPSGLPAPTLEDLGLPESLRELAGAQDGLVLITGPPGTPTEPTLAAMVDAANAGRARVILTVEDPADYAFVKRNGILKRRELGRDVASYADGLRSAVRQDVDFAAVADLGDRAAMEAAFHAVETGRLVVGVLHARTPVDALHRVASLFPPEARPAALYRLSETLRAIIGLRLTPDDPRPRVKVVETDEQLRVHIETGKLDQVAERFR